ncbi:MAG TPA: hypothetical protein VK325_03940 [Pseudoxanthomonas sp.]|nr:hypothetical protein [Pseudoxanthomonas sp.]
MIDRSLRREVGARDATGEGTDYPPEPQEKPRLHSLIRPSGTFSRTKKETQRFLQCLK